MIARRAAPHALSLLAGIALLAGSSAADSGSATLLAASSAADSGAVRTSGEGTPPLRPAASIGILLTDGEVIEALGVEPAPFDMVRITEPDGGYRYLAPVRVRAVFDESGEDRTRSLLEDHEKVGTPLPPALGPRKRGLRVGPRSVTRYFPITETTLLGRFDRANGGPGPECLDFDMGMLWNVAENTAVGGTAFVGSGGPFDFKAGVRLRVRYWVSRTASLDLAPGVIVLGRQISSGTALPPGLSLQVSLNPSRYLSLTTEVFTVRWRECLYDGLRAISSEEYSDTGIMAGVRVGQWPGAVAGVLPLILSLFTATVVSTP